VVRVGFGFAEIGHYSLSQRYC